MFNRAKTSDILRGTALLKVNSFQKPISKKTRKSLIISATLIYLLGLAYGAYITSGAPHSMTLSLFTILTALYALVIVFAIILGTARENALIITDRGLAYWPIVSERWEDVESYCWEEFRGLRRVPGPTVLSSYEGVTLKLRNKGFFQRCLESKTGHSIFATYSIYFSPEQIAATDSVMNQHGIRKEE